MNLYKQYFKEFPKIKEIVESIKLNKATEISEASSSIASLISVLLQDEIEEDIVLIYPNTYQAQKAFDELSPLIDNIFFYPKDDFISVEMMVESLDFKLQRINTLKAIFTNKKQKTIITSLSGLLTKTPQKETYESKIITLKKNTTIKPKELLDKLIESGYDRNYTIEKQGELSLRGSIFDVFPINEDKAYRIDFFGNDIESIKVLDVETQRSLGEIDSITIMPKNEILFSDTEKATIRFFIEDKLSQDITQKSKEKFSQDLEYLDDKCEFSFLQKYLSLFLPNNYSFLDYIDKKLVCFVDYNQIKEQEINIEDHIYSYLQNYKDYFNAGTFINTLSTYFFDKTLYVTNRKLNYSLKEISLHSITVPSFENRLEYLKLDFIEKNKTILLFASNANYEVLSEYLTQEKIKFHEPKTKIKENAINLIKDHSFINLDIEEFNFKSINEAKIFKSYRQSGSKYKLEVETKRLKSITDLKIGDYVVHIDYGIGRFKEITTMTLGNRTNDYIHIQYDKDQSVYIPVENLSVLSKYAGSDSVVPKLSSLNSKEWNKTKNEARQKASDLAERLLNLYSDREKMEGFKYLADDELQKDFDSGFNYELTTDQEKAINDVKFDMENGKLMDRLVCGDVGFGKTEVALRAAFKAVLSGKQVAYLAPTTILSRQHYYTFKNRMDRFGINIALVNRFVSSQQIKSNLYDLSVGNIDIIIGTHRLLSNDVSFKNLGLLIIDEEQRFGVEAKEKIKELKNNIDILTLTATPIPRTLQMAITGIKDISLIETAPKGRYPVQTYVLERNDFVVKDAIERELSKSGQVFYLYNRVEDMDRIERYVASLVPDARISVIHGKMDKFEIEDTIEKFINKESDILISTTIIETGIDIPNVNTLIVHDADRYGLSQLYQIKGRVGRSDKISYAYLMYDKNKNLTEDAQKRLQAIKDFASLGSGFKIAVRDLTNRGAGEILGKEQSGFMNRVGVELYLKMLDEEVQKKKGVEVKSNEDDISVIMSKHIDKDYISDEYVIIEIHTKISKLSSTLELENLKAELEDRFGPVKDNLLEYMHTKLAENLINSVGFERVDQYNDRIVMVFSSEKSKTLDAQSLFKYAIETSKNFSFTYKVYKIMLIYDARGGRFAMFKDVVKLIERLKSDYII